MKRPAATDAATHAVSQRALKQVSTWDTVFSELSSWVEANSSWPRQHSAHPLEASLAKWMSNQRQAKRDGSLSNARAIGLEALAGWSWNPQDDRWSDAFTRVKAWVAEHGNLPDQGGDDAVEASLAKWMNNQRQARRCGTLTNDHVIALENWPGWSWAPQADEWHSVLSRVKCWVAAHESLPQQGSDDAVEASLAKWMNNQRQARRCGTLANDRVAELEQWPEWTWLPRVDQWQASLAALRLWLSEHQQQMPQRHSENREEAALATWVDHQRGARQNGILSQDQLRALELLSVWTWQPREVQWEAWYQLAWSWFFGPPCSLEAPRASYPRSTKDHGVRVRSSEEVAEVEGPSFADGLEDEESDQPEYHHSREQSPARPLALWMLRQRLAYRHGSLSKPRSERLQQLPQWTWTRVGGELEPQQGWDHHFKHFLDWLEAHQGRLPSTTYPASAFERRLADWYRDNQCQFFNATSDPTSAGCCHEPVKLTLRKSIVPDTEEEWLHWRPTSTLTRDERVHWVTTLPKLFGSWDCWSWWKMDQYLKGVLSRPEKYRSPLAHPDQDKEWGPDWTAFFDRVDPSILAPRASDYILVRSPPMPWERVRLFMLLQRERMSGHKRFKGNTKAHELLVEVDTGLIAQGAHKRADSTVGCPCCVPELHVSKSFPVLRRCSCYPPYEFVCTEGVWRCTGQWNKPVITVGMPPPLPSGQLTLDAFSSFRPASPSNASSSA